MAWALLSNSLQPVAVALFDPSFYDPSIAVAQDPSTVITRGDRSLQRHRNAGSGWPDARRMAESLADTGDSAFFSWAAQRIFTNASEISNHALGSHSLLTTKRCSAGGKRPTSPLGVSDSFSRRISAAAHDFNRQRKRDYPAGGTNRDFPMSVITRSRPEIPKHGHGISRSSVISTRHAGRSRLRRRHGLHLQRERSLNQLAPGTLQANPGE
jgi:hypothetical protein